MEVKGYRDLRVWQAAMDLVEVIYRLTLAFPQSELFNLTTGLRRSAITIPTKIAEGHVSEQLKDYLYGIDGAQKTLAMLQTQIEVAGRLKYVGPEAVEETLGKTEALSIQLYSLRNALLRNG